MFIFFIFLKKIGNIFLFLSEAEYGTGMDLLNIMHSEALPTRAPLLPIIQECVLQNAHFEVCILMLSSPTTLYS